MGTYDTRGGSPISPDELESADCAGCGKLLENCECEQTGDSTKCPLTDCRLNGCMRLPCVAPKVVPVSVAGNGPSREELLGDAIRALIRGELTCSDDLPVDKRPSHVSARRAFGAVWELYKERNEFKQKALQYGQERDSYKQEYRTARQEAHDQAMAAHHQRNRAERAEEALQSAERDALERAAKVIDLLVLERKNGDNRDHDDELFFEFCEAGAKAIRALAIDSAIGAEGK